MENKKIQNKEAKDNEEGVVPDEIKSGVSKSNVASEVIAYNKKKLEDQVVSPEHLAKVDREIENGIKKIHKRTCCDKGNSCRHWSTFFFLPYEAVEIAAQVIFTQAIKQNQLDLFSKHKRDQESDIMFDDVFRVKKREEKRYKKLKHAYIEQMNRAHDKRLAEGGDGH